MKQTFQADILKTGGAALLLLAFSTSVFAGEIRYDSGGRRDPFKALIGPGGTLTYKSNPSDLNIEGIIYDPKGTSLVLLNGEFYRQGETVKQSKIISIMKDRVILSHEEEERVLWLRDEVVNSNAAEPKDKAENEAPKK